MVESRLDKSSSSSRSPHSSLEFYEHIDFSTPIVAPDEFRPLSAGHSDHSLESLNGNARREMSELSLPDHSNIGSNQRRSRSQQGNVNRPVAQRSSQGPSPNTGFPSSSSSSSENIHGPDFQGSYRPANVQYSQRPSFLGQYPTSTQTTPVPMAHGPPLYAYSPYHHPVMAENNMISQTTHSNYPPMLQPGTVFPYQQHSPDSNSRPHLSPFPPPRSPIYAPPNSSQASPQISSGSSNTILPSYVPGTFHSLQYPSSMTPTPYAYHPHSFTPVYQPQYPPLPTFQRYPSSGEENQATWYYLHPGPATLSPPYQSGPSYQARFPSPYATSGQQEAETMYHPPPSTHVGSVSPNIRPESQASADSPRIIRTASGIHNSTPLLASSSSGVNKPLEKPVVRRSYHPNPPAHRSEWVMWAGNVPSDATHDELWRFFNQQSPEGLSCSLEGTGVLSIFLISRSSCAFVNYESNFFLQEAVSRFNGAPLRPNDSRCPRLVCRVRRLDDDLKAGVGGQRGMGMHTKWIKERKCKERSLDEGVSIETSDVSLSSSPVSLSERMAAAVSSMSMSGDENMEEKRRWRAHAKHSSSSGSFASTNSSVLARHFPKRYFILKSLSQHDLDLSVETGLWATQRHNEEILDQAFRTSKEVYLVFGVNKSGEFYGYARMAGPVRRGQQRVSWASRSSQSSASRSSQSPLASRSKGDIFFSPNDFRLAGNSPLPVEADTPEAKKVVHHSAPAMLGGPYNLPQISPVERFSLDQGLSRVESQEDFHLDNDAPQRAMRHQESSHDVKPQVVGRRPGPSLQSVDETEEKENKVDGDGRQVEERKEADAWGDSFEVEWMSTLRLPFHRTRDLRNPWNHDREIKVSRDGTELEPTVGERLLEEWGKLARELQRQTV